MSEDVNIFDEIQPTERRMNIIRLDKLRPDDPTEDIVEYDVSELDAARAVEALYMLRLEHLDLEQRCRQTSTVNANAYNREQRFAGAIKELLLTWFAQNADKQVDGELTVETKLFGTLTVKAPIGSDTSPIIKPHGRDFPLLTIPAESSIAERLRIILDAEAAADRTKETARQAAAVAKLADDNLEQLRGESKHVLMTWAKAHPVPGKQYALCSLDTVGKPDVTVKLGWRAGTQYPEVENEAALIASYVTPLTTEREILVDIADDKGKVTQEALLSLIPARWNVNTTVLGKALRRGMAITGAFLKPAVESLSIGRQT